jgi:hypothetical protein
MFQIVDLQNLANFGYQEGHQFELQNLCWFWNFGKKISGRARMPVAHDGPWLRVSASARRHHGGSITTRHLAPADRPPSTLHAQPMQPPPPRTCHVLMPRSCHVEALFPSSPSAATKLSPHSTLLTIRLCHWCAYCRCALGWGGPWSSPWPRCELLPLVGSPGLCVSCFIPLQG